MTQKNNSTSYKSLISNLEKIIKDLESNKASIDKSIDLYQKGMNLVVECEKKLLNIEKNTNFKNTSKKSLPKKFDIETKLKEVEGLIEKIRDDSIGIEETGKLFMSAYEKITYIENYLNKINVKIKKYE
ncbi:MAG: exodeoxyribonuclease VII small subunit [Gammaproteobacteria bacterium]|nr:exodeoxyribonuclease VII small subunit [Gammaproteobacteria bacterium]|tara:strand:- start:317 stop:703 length:387 start_codon:yes stop_codon:yes gene_type:complete